MVSLIVSIVFTILLIVYARQQNTLPTNFIDASLSVIEYDGCEYVYSRTLSFNGDSAMLAHKGNCKYCLERRKKEF